MENSTNRGGAGAAQALDGADEVELKLTIPEAKESSARTRFNLRRANSHQRRIWFYDTGKLDLYHRGVVLRAREIYGDDHDSTVKFRPVEAAKVSLKWRKLPGFKIEADGVGGKLVPSASLTVVQGKSEIGEVAAGKRDIHKLYSSDQEEFLKEMAPKPVDFEKLSNLGPIEAHRWKFKDPGLPYDITAEEWRLPDGRDLLEVSIKVKSEQLAAAVAGFNAFLDELGFGAEANQETKTRVALEFFAKRLAGS